MNETPQLLSELPQIDVSVIVPAFNEEATIGELIRRLLALDLSAEIIVVNGGSTDNTGIQLAPFSGSITILTNSSQTGKGDAIRQALRVATGKVVVIQDADLEYEPEELPQVVAPILEGSADVVFGSRFHHGFPRGMAWPNRVVNKLLVLAVLLLYGKKLTDEATCYKAFRRELLVSMDLHCHRFEFCPEVTAKTMRLRRTITEVPIRYTPRTAEAGKKIRWTDAPDAFWTLLRYRFWRPR